MRQCDGLQKHIVAVNLAKKQLYKYLMQLVLQGLLQLLLIQWGTYTKYNDDILSSFVM